MYQSFDDESDSDAVPGRMRAFREELAARKLDGFLVPHSDEHQNEFLPASAERLRFLTGFTGSAGVAIILTKTAVLFVDGRYSLQARAQIPDLFEVLQTPEAKASRWVKDNLPGGGAIGYDPKLHTVKEIERLTETLAKADIALKPQPTNPIDLIWQDRPPSPAAAVVPHPLEFAGRSAKEKLVEIRETLAKDKVDAALLTLPDSIAWLFNIRGADIAHTPVALAFALVPASGKASLFIEAAKLGDNVRGHLADVAEIVSPGELEGRLTALGKSGARIRLDPETASVHFKQVLEAAGAKIVSGEDPCILPKAIKSEAEIAGARAAHLRDGAAMARFLAWLDENAAGGNVDEISAAERLEELRRETGKLKDLSFDTISAAGAHGAIVHYRPTRATNAKIEPEHAVSDRFRRAICRRHH